MKIMATVEISASTYPKINSLPLPFPIAANRILAAAVHVEIGPNTFQIPGAGSNPWGLPPFRNHEKKNIMLLIVAQLAPIKAA